MGYSNDLFQKINEINRKKTTHDALTILTSWPCLRVRSCGDYRLEFEVTSMPTKKHGITKGSSGVDGLPRCLMERVHSQT